MPIALLSHIKTTLPTAATAFLALGVVGINGIVLPATTFLLLQGRHLPTANPNFKPCPEPNECDNPDGDNDGVGDDAGRAGHWNLNQYGDFDWRGSVEVVDLQAKSNPKPPFTTAIRIMHGPTTRWIFPNTVPFPFFLKMR